MRNLSVKAKVLLCSYVPLLLALGIGAVAILSINAMQRTQAWVDHTQNVLRQANAIVLEAVNMETGMRGYLLAGDVEFQEPLISGQENFRALISELAQTVSDNPGQVERLQDAEATIDNWISEIVEPRLLLRTEIGNADTMNDMADLVAEGRGKVYFDEFRELIGRFIDNEAALLEERSAELNRMLNSGFADSGTFADALEWVNHTYRVIIQAEQILSYAIDMETGMRGYLLAGREEFLEPFENGSTRFEGLIDDLMVTVDDNPPQVELLREAKTTIEEWRANVVQPMIELRRSIGDAPNMDDMSDIVRSAEGKIYFDAFRQIMADFAAEEETLMGMRIAANNERRTSTLTLIGAAMALAAIVGTALALVIGRNIGGAVSQLTSVMTQLADGSTAVNVPHQARTDEVGGMAQATEVFKQNSLRIAELGNELEEERSEQREKLVGGIGAAMRELASGNLSIRLNDNMGEDYSGLVRSFNDALVSLEELVQSISESSETVTSTIGAISESSTTLSQQTEASAAALQETTSALTQISASVGVTSQNAAEADRLAKMVKDNAEAADQLVGETVNSVSRIDEASKKVAQISTSISDIAFQTNLLALNAGVEAARAGNSGSGFAVVANEVRALALRTSEAAAEIENLIKHSNEETQQGVDLVERTSAALHEIVGEIDRLTSSVGGIASEAEQQAEGLGQIQEAMSNLENNTQQNAVGLEETAAATLSLSDEAERLKTQIARFDADGRGQDVSRAA